MGPLKVVDELRDQAEELLGVLVRSLAEPDLEERGKGQEVGLQTSVTPGSSVLLPLLGCCRFQSQRPGSRISSFLPLAANLQQRPSASTTASKARSLV